MSLLALMASRASAAPVDPEDPGVPEDTTPYDFPTARPYNVPVHMVTALGEVTHPSVVDFASQHGTPLWNGHRYWMAITPYPSGASGPENPCIQMSDDGFTWTTPVGLTNPIDPPPGSVGYNSDTELVFEPSTGRLWCFWREHNHSGPEADRGEILHSAWSTNGVTWTKVERILVHRHPENPARAGGFVSPVIWTPSTGAWRMVSIGNLVDSSNPKYWTATAATGPWTLVGPVTFNWIGGPALKPWHFGACKIGDVYLGALDINGPPGQQSVYACSSTDGISWTVDGASPLIAEIAESWDLRPYRTCLAPHENGTHARVWYSASTNTGTWYAAYTQIPLSEWPTSS